MKEWYNSLDGNDLLSIVWVGQFICIILSNTIVYLTDFTLKKTKKFKRS